MTPKEFALQAIAPYYKDPSTCGWSGFQCLYLTKDGKKCVAGRYMKNPDSFDGSGGIGQILKKYIQEEIFVPEVVDILTNEQWQQLQQIHDNIAALKGNTLENYCNELELFTFEELKEYSQTQLVENETVTG